MTKKITLFKRGTSDKILEWSVWPTETGYSTEYGQQGGKMVRDDYTPTPKNVGRANETNVEKQSVIEMNSRIKSTLDGGYFRKVEDIDTFIFLPMLASDHTTPNTAKKMRFPCFVQPKLDGVRCTVAIDIEGNIEMRTRRGKKFPHCQFIGKQLLEAGYTNVIFDGELFSDAMTFQKLAGLLRKESIDLLDRRLLPTIHMVVFDIVPLDDLKMTNKNRLRLLKQLLPTTERDELPNIKRIATLMCTDKDALEVMHKKFSENYEGTILRNIEGEYAVNARSKDLQKLKTFLDSEYTIVGAAEGGGRDTGTVIWICECPTEDGNATFRCRPRGTVAERKAWFENQSQHFGKQLTVRYQELTDDGIPRFPVGIAIRDYE